MVSSLIKEKRMKLKLAIFDWNGTLLNDLPIVYGSVKEIFSRHNLPAPTLEQYRDEITVKFMDFYYNHGFPRDTKPEALNAIRKEYLQEHWREAELHDGAEDLLELSKSLGMHVAIVSGEMTELLEKRLQELNLHHLIDHVAGQAYNKEEVLISTLDRFGTKAENAFYLDDTYDGLMAAKHAGLITIGFQSGYNSKERLLLAEPDFPNSEFRDVKTHTTVGEIILRGGVR